MLIVNRLVRFFHMRAIGEAFLQSGGYFALVRACSLWLAST